MFKPSRKVASLDSSAEVVLPCYTITLARTRQKGLAKKIEELSWEVVDHQPYIPNLAPTDYHLFRSLEHSLRGNRFAKVDDPHEHLSIFFNLQPTDFYRRRIEILELY
ncbi:hypothetical protein Aduo_019164 [Ancylostoma duodenale]